MAADTCHRHKWVPPGQDRKLIFRTLGPMILGIGAILAIPHVRFILEHGGGIDTGVRDWFAREVGPTRSNCGAYAGPSALKVIASAQADYRANDRDGNGTHDYWRGDIAGLYALQNGGPIRLIDLNTAAADSSPITPIRLYTAQSFYWGWRLCALRHEGETTPGPQRFAACAYPATYAYQRRYTHIIDEGNTVYSKDLGHGRGIRVFPSDPEAEGWTRFD